jgi:hypothetical protein
MAFEGSEFATLLTEKGERLKIRIGLIRDY